VRILDVGTQSPESNSLKLLVELEPRRRALWSSAAAAFRPVRKPQDHELGVLRDVFVHRGLPWWRFAESAVLHLGAAALVWMVSAAWLRQQNVQVRPGFDRSDLITYSPEEYLPPLDTGSTDPALQAKGDPVPARQPILSVPPEADNRSQTIVTPPDIKLAHDVPLPNIIATGTPAPEVPIEATRVALKPLVAPEVQVVAPAPELETAQNRVVRSALTSPIAPPPEVTAANTRGIAGPDSSVVEPPPDVPRLAVGRASSINFGPSQVVAPAPQLPVSEQHTVYGRGTRGFPSTSVQPVAPPPSVSGVSGGKGSGRLVALGIHPVAPVGPVSAPDGNRRGTFAASPQGRAGASGTPGGPNGSTSAASGNGGHGTNGNHGHTDRTLPSGLHVGGADSAAVLSSNGTGSGKTVGGDSRELASVVPPRVGAASKPAAAVPDDKVTDVDRQVFGSKRFYSMVANMPNLNSATGSWVIRYAELKDGQPGLLTTPDAYQKSDPGYPIELMRANVQGTVTLYAVIHSDGTVGDIRVLSSPDERLEPFAKSALARWRFHPATKDGKPVALEAVVSIPFRINRNALKF
jgi:TonB family protein